MCVHTLPYTFIRFRTLPYALVHFRTLSYAFIHFHTRSHMLSYAFICFHMLWYAFIRCWCVGVSFCVALSLDAFGLFMTAIVTKHLWHLHNAFGGTNKTVNRFWCIFFDPAITNEPASRAYINTSTLSILTHQPYRFGYAAISGEQNSPVAETERSIALTPSKSIRRNIFGIISQPSLATEKCWKWRMTFWATAIKG